MHLLPHQVAFVEAVLNPASPPVTLLQGDPCLGKGAALVALASRVLRERTTARILFLVPGTELRSQFVEMLQRSDTPVLFIDRYKFRELLESSTGKEIWPTGVVAVLSRELARQKDIIKSLASVRWDLFIVDEVYRFTASVFEDVIPRVCKASDRIVLATIPDPVIPAVLPCEVINVIAWYRNKIVDNSGQRLDTIPHPILHTFHYNLSPAELNLTKTVGELCQFLELDMSSKSWRAKSLLHSLESSPSALESALTRIQEDKDQREYETSAPWFPQIVLFADPPDPYWDLGTVKKAADLAVRALESMEAVGCDSKLAAFVDVLRDIDALKQPKRRICVLTDYVSTLFYLATEMENIGMVCHTFYGAMNAESRQSALAAHSNGGGILTATCAVFPEAVTLSEVTDLLMYDIPSTPVALEQVLGWFNRFGRKSPLNVYSFLPSNIPGIGNSEPLDPLQKAIGAPDADTIL